jgi:hypothetical protein
MKTTQMKTTLLLVLVLSSFVALGADTATPSNAPSATITGVSAAKDKRTLVIRYELSGHAHEQRVAFTNDITDFRYCRWLGERGIAVVASTRAGEFFYATLYLKGRDVAVSPAKIPAPTGLSHLLGIANTSGDSIVITAVQHRRGAPDRLTGWMFIDHCPPIGAAVGLVVPFDIPAERPDQKE